MKSQTKKIIRDGLILEILFLREQRVIFSELAENSKNREIIYEILDLLSEKLRRRRRDLQDLMDGIYVIEI